MDSSRGPQQPPQQPPHDKAPRPPRDATPDQPPNDQRPQKAPYGEDPQPHQYEDASQRPPYDGHSQQAPYGPGPQQQPYGGDPQRLRYDQQLPHDQQPYGQGPGQGWHPSPQPPYGQPPYQQPSWQGQPPQVQGGPPPWPPEQRHPQQWPPQQLPPPGWSPQPPQPWQPQPWGQPWPAPAYWAPPAPRTVAAPPGVPFHRLARNGLHRWWRPLLGSAFLLAVGFLLITGVVIGWEVVHAVLTGDFATPEGDQLFFDPTEDLAATLVILGVLTPVVLLTVRLVQRRPAGSVASVLNRLRWRWLLLCCLPAFGYLVVSYALGFLAEAIFPSADIGDGGSWVGWGGFLVPALVILLLVPFQAAAEEFVFRGWLLQAIGSYGPERARGVISAVFRSPWPAIVISSGLFVAAHGYTGWALADIFLFAMTVGWLAVRTGGLESGIALHTLNNLLAFLPAAAAGQLSGWSEQGGAPWTVLLVDGPSLALYAAAVVWLARRRRLDSVTPLPVQSSSGVPVIS